MQQWTILKLLEWTTAYFTKHGIPNPRLDAELLLSYTLSKKRIELYLSFEQILTDKELATFKAYVQRRTSREPLQYITGTQEFWGISIKVTPSVLIPRPETELLVEETLKMAKRWRHPRPRLNHSGVNSSGDPVNAGDSRFRGNDMPFTILDLCTGSGAIIAALASELPNAHFIGIDVSEKAIEIARQNTDVCKDRVEFLCGNLFEATQYAIRNTKYDIIVSNPPYVAENEWPTLQPEIREHEPREAIVAGEDGLAIIGQIIDDAPKFLKAGGWLFLEIGDGQAEAVKKMITHMGCYNIPEVKKDYGGIDRIVATSKFEARNSNLETNSNSQML